MPFNLYYETIRRKQKIEAVIWSVVFLSLYLASGYIAEFNLQKIFLGLPKFFDYLRDTLPVLHLNVLFSDVKTEGSLAYWGYRLPIQLPLILETIHLALAATLVSMLIAIICGLLCAKNTPTPRLLKTVLRALLAFLRTMPELAWALMFVMAFGIGAFAGFLAIALHSIGSLSKLFYEAIETVSEKPNKGLTAVGANAIARMRFGFWPQVKPIIYAYSFLRFEANFRQSTILGIVGAGGIGQELVLSIKLDRYDQVSLILLLIIIFVSIIDGLSGFARKRMIEGRQN